MDSVVVGGDASGNCMQQHEVACNNTILACNNTILHATTRNGMQQHEYCMQRVLAAKVCNWVRVATMKHATEREIAMQRVLVAPGGVNRKKLHVYACSGEIVVKSSCVPRVGANSGKRGWSSEGSAQSHLTSCQKVALHRQLQMSSDLLEQEEEEEVRGRGRK